ncbi:MAG: hypothetical protein ABJB66_20325 [Gemmatimonadaceae bacterium]
MTDSKKQDGQKAGAKHDSDEGLQRELERETNEGGDKKDDVNSNRNLSGSSTWETLPENKKGK